jgi:tRNA1(Val) A37 N6-methylase TrmN6
MTHKENRKMTSVYTNDNFLGGKLKIQQPVKGFRSGSDAVFLAASLKDTTTGSILEVGCGAGVASLCAAYRLKNTHIIGIDCDEHLVTLAQENAKNNQLEKRTTFMVQDIQNPLKNLVPQSFDRVFSNPPYFKDSTVSEDKSRTQSRHYNETAFLEDWVNFCLKMAKPRGHVHFIFPSPNLQELLNALPLSSVGELTLFPLWPKADSDQSKRTLLTVRKGVSSPSILHKGIVLHNKDDGYTPAAHAVLWEGMGLKLSS